MPDPVDLSHAFDTVIAALAQQFPTFRTVAAEDEDRQSLPVPAILVQISEIEPEPDNDVHTGQFPCMVRFEARVILGHRTPRVRREVIAAAGALAAFVHNNRLGMAWGAATVVSVAPDEFAPMANQFDVWAVEWMHETHLGENYFADDGITPTELLTSWSPDTGPDHESEYTVEASSV